MKKGKMLGQFYDILKKIIVSFLIVFLLYFTTKFIDHFTYKYFVFPFISIIIIFICGVNVGKSLEKMKYHENSSSFMKNKIEEQTEFYVNDTRDIITNKKILKELEDGDIVHVKSNRNYNIEEIEQNNSDIGSVE